MQIRDFHVAKREEDIGYYAGYIGIQVMFICYNVDINTNQLIIVLKIKLQIHEGSSYMLGRALTSVIWGAIADKFGRKPVIIIGCAAVLVITYAFFALINILILNVTGLVIGHFCANHWSIVIFRVIFNTLFGLSTNFWMAISMRFLLGSLNGLLGPIKVFCNHFASMLNKINI